MHLMLHLGFKCLLNVLGCSNLSPLSLSEKGLQKAAFLLHTQVLMTASTLAWRFNRCQPQAVVGGNDAAHRRDRHARISGDLFCFPRRNQGVVNDPPAFSHPKAWIHFHATFDFFQWIMSSSPGDARPQNRSLSLPTLFPRLIPLGTPIGIRWQISSFQDVAIQRQYV